MHVNDSRIDFFSSNIPAAAAALIIEYSPDTWDEKWKERNTWWGDDERIIEVQKKAKKSKSLKVQKSKSPKAQKSKSQKVKKSTNPHYLGTEDEKISKCLPAHADYSDLNYKHLTSQTPNTKPSIQDSNKAMTPAFPPSSKIDKCHKEHLQDP